MRGQVLALPLLAASIPALCQDNAQIQMQTTQQVQTAQQAQQQIQMAQQANQQAARVAFT